MKRRFVAFFISVTLLLCAFGASAASFNNNQPDFIPYSYENTGNTADDFVAHASSQVGYVEGSGSWNAFGNYYGNSSGAWCVYFLRWCADMAGLPADIFPHSAAGRVSDYWDTSIDSRLEFHPVDDLDNPYTPKKGDIVIYRPYNTYYDTTTGLISTTPTDNSILCRRGRCMSGGNYLYISHIGLVTEDCTAPTNNGANVNYATFSMIDGNWGGRVVSRVESYHDVTGFISIKHRETEPQINPSIGEWSVLQRGDRGFDVYVLQSLLNVRLGIQLDTDGVFGALTKAAVVEFQQLSGARGSGIVTETVWKALTNYSQSIMRHDPLSTALIQRILNEKFGASLDIDGGYGPLTESAVAKVQAIFGIRATGVTTPATWRLLICGKLY